MSSWTRACARAARSASTGHERARGRIMMERTTGGRTGWWILGLPALLALALVAGAQAQAPVTIKYGAPTSTPDITTIGIYFALENGYFKRDGLDVQVTRYQGSPVAVRALLSGDADVVETGGGNALPPLESSARKDHQRRPAGRRE